MTADPASLPPVRRIVTAINAQGLSYIAEDGASPATLTHEGRPGYRNANLWRTSGLHAPASIHAPDDITAHRGVLPPRRGTVLRVIDFPPEPADPVEQRRRYEAVFKNMFDDATHQPGSARHPGMHVTHTIDYAIVLSGEIVAVMDEGETLMRAGDVLIQRGTHHAWANRSAQVARVAFVLIDGQEGDDGPR